MVKNKFWLYDFKQLFKNNDLLPMDNMSFDSKLNCITRLVIVIYLVMLLLDCSNPHVFLVISLLIIIITSFISIELEKKREDFMINGIYSGHPNPKTTVPPCIVNPLYSNGYRPEVNQNSREFLRENGQVYTGVNQPRQIKQQTIQKVKPISRVDKIPVYINEHQPGDMVNRSEYAPNKKIYANLQSNETTERYQEHPILANYNKSINTQIIQPGVYTKNEIMEPQLYNLGISHTQQFQPLNVENDELGNVVYAQKDPRLFSKTETKQKMGISESNVYDPRYTGYGTSERGYIDNMGRPRFFYDDINAVKEGNFIIRSNVDTLPMTDHYGVWSEKSYSREQVHEEYNNAMMNNRIELQERLMRKMNDRIVQQRKAPIHTRNTK